MLNPQRMTSRTSRKSGLSVTNMEDVIKFKLVEDLSLVTVPVTTCLIVLVTYIFCGAALFSAWEVSPFIREPVKNYNCDKVTIIYC